MKVDQFEWDDTKALANYAKHGVTFETARGVFTDPFAVEFVDDRQDYGEVRYVIIGMVESRLLTVIHTERGKRTRIISARAAEPFERREYHDQDI